MPILPPVSAQPYDTVTTVLNIARGRMNDDLDTLQGVSGRILKNGQVFTQQTVNTAWRKLQEYLSERGYARVINECVISSLPVAGSSDPSTQAWLSWQGYFDGLNFFPQPALPGELTHPLKIWERWSGSNAQFADPPMEKILDGLPSVQKTSRNRFWEWRGDTIYFPGSQMIEDFRIRYVKYLEDFLDSGNTPWFNLQVPIVRVGDGFSWFICAELAGARGDNDLSDKYMGRGEAALNRIFNLDVAADQRVNIRRQSRSGRGNGRTWY